MLPPSSTEGAPLATADVTAFSKNPISGNIGQKWGTHSHEH